MDRKTYCRCSASTQRVRLHLVCIAYAVSDNTICLLSAHLHRVVAQVCSAAFAALGLSPCACIKAVCWIVCQHLSIANVLLKYVLLCVPVSRCVTPPTSRGGGHTALSIANVVLQCVLCVPVSRCVLNATPGVCPMYVCTPRVVVRVLHTNVWSQL